mgnify:CR=1 FL=1
MVFDDRFERLFKFFFVERLDPLEGKIVINCFHEPVTKFRRLTVGVVEWYSPLIGDRIDLSMQRFNFDLSEFLGFTALSKQECMNFIALLVFQILYSERRVESTAGSLDHAFTVNSTLAPAPESITYLLSPHTA